MEATKPWRVAVLADIHGNLRALDAVLGELEKERPDFIVFGGDVASGPFPRQVLERLMALRQEKGERVLFVCGNADREIVAAFDRMRAGRQIPDRSQEENPALLFGSWAAERIDREQRDFLAGFQARIALPVTGLGSALFCHGSPRSDEEIITRFTSRERLNRLLAGVQEKVVVCGHTHHQFDLRTGGARVVNAGSVGMPYEGRPGAYWALLGPGVELRRTEYDAARAVEEAMGTDYPDPDYPETILHPPESGEVAEYFENIALEREQGGAG